MSSEHDAAGPCDLFVGGWEDYQAARGRFFADRAAETREYTEEREPAAGGQAHGVQREALRPPPSRAPA
jgi:hypothetical protein